MRIDHSLALAAALVVATLLAPILPTTARAAPDAAESASDSTRTLAIAAPGSPSPSHGWLAPDRLQHASFSLAAGLAVGIATEEPAAAVGVSFGLGVSKELIDERFDWVDLAADFLGAALAALLTHALR